MRGAPRHALRRRTRLALRVTAAIVAVVVLYVGVTFAQVWLASRRDDARPAGAIVVLGAAQYDGVPSPVLEARLDHALELYRQDYADVVVVTGGSRPGDRFTEARASADYLLARGVPDSAIRREVQGSSSWESLAAAAAFLRREGIDDVLLVSDPYHSLRLEAIADEVDLEGHVSPTRASPLSTAATLRAMVRETMAVSVGRLVGYRRLVRLDR